MTYGINWNNGYEVCVTMLNENGSATITRPLRKFRSQTDALDFKLYDCPRFTLEIVKHMVKSYNNKVNYIRKGFRNYKKEVIA